MNHSEYHETRLWSISLPTYSIGKNLKKLETIVDGNLDQIVLYSISIVAGNMDQKKGQAITDVGDGYSRHRYAIRRRLQQPRLDVTDQER